MPKPKLEEFEFERKPSRKTTKQKFSDFIFDENTGAILGRTPESWGLYLYILNILSK